MERRSDGLQPQKSAPNVGARKRFWDRLDYSTLVRRRKLYGIIGIVEHQIDKKTQNEMEALYGEG